MEMPEGWIEAVKTIKKYGYAPDNIPHNSEFIVLRDALKLMKEMAEALELSEKHFGSNPITWLALQNFKEWK